MELLERTNGKLPESDCEAGQILPVYSRKTTSRTDGFAALVRDIWQI